ncbi:hypothetical protein EIP86_000247 [Pleurotus ostreatoroseus]|nr:hypothetical protein EIP86_000247 [Pleurotus ostreatoroseus]
MERTVDGPPTRLRNQHLPDRIVEEIVRFQHLLNSSPDFVQRVKSRLFELDEVYEYDELLEGLSRFLSFSTPDAEPEEGDYFRVLNALQLEELSVAFIDCAVARPTWLETSDVFALNAELRVMSTIDGMVKSGH